MSKSADAINEYLNYEFRGASAPSTSGSFFINLSTTTITDSGSGSTLPPEAYNYTELVLSKSENNWTPAYEGGITNAVLISFPSGSEVSTGDWGTIMGITLSDTTKGAPRYFYNLPLSIEINDGGRITFPAGSLEFMRKSD